MDIILLDRVAGLGDLGDKVSVKSGYARNFLIPQGKATEATKTKIAEFEARRADLEKQQAERLAETERRAEQLNEKVLTIFAKCGDEGKLFGSVGTQQIASAAEQQGLTLARNEILMPHGTIRELGEYPIDLKLYGDIHAQVIVRIVEAN
ncbi:50S ribosomal protein L9 [Suttonella ornithocola]|uniref:Large ribosomal subunit protein bL9 n=1 Tax=Suttonella ornithocola TaxID=279832 RepID=A0A380MQE5_9GAMM|nr:50S ribosomal protein L9 [Suttonella ornithocola]SUO94394.1 50S ribosomal protein L9 [Suttonella ornithocola]